MKLRVRIFPRLTDMLFVNHLQTLLKDNPQFVYPASRRNEVLGWVQGGVRDFSISRAATQWGIKFPQDSKQTVYVWFDALNGYLSGTANCHYCLFPMKRV